MTDNQRKAIINALVRNGVTVDLAHWLCDLDEQVAAILDRVQLLEEQLGINSTPALTVEQIPEQGIYGTHSTKEDK